MHKLFVDLDGVLVDFDRGVKDALGAYPHELDPKAMWPRLARTSDFYARLPWMPDGKDLWLAVRDWSPTILTGLPLGRWAEPQKRAWCLEHLGPDIPVVCCLSRHKAREAAALTPQDVIPVLVDDRLSLQESWEAMGGIFIFHQSASASIERINKLFKAS